MTLSDAYAEYLLATDDYHQSISDGRRVIDAISLNDYSLRRAFTGKDPKKVIQNGKTIKNYIQLRTKNTAHFFGAGATEATSDPQLVNVMETKWSMFRDSITWDEEMFDFHEGDMAQRFFDLRRAQKQQLWQEKVRFLEEEAFWSAADPVTMETANAVQHTQPWNVLVNEENFGTANAAIPESYVAGTVFTVQGVDRRTAANGQNWRPIQKPYLGGPNVPIANDTLLSSLTDTARRCKFMGLPMGLGEYSNKSTMPAVVWCSFDGYTMLEQDCLQRQDAFVAFGKQDPAYPALQIYGVPVETLPILSTALIFPTGGASFAAAGSAFYSYERDLSGTTNAGPRFFFMNLKDMYVVVHSTKFFYMHKQLTPHNMPNRHSVFVDSYCNTTAEQCRTSGIVFPGNDIDGYRDLA